jgi:HAD superfamily phosphoserine phosphatase-like hydrolase
MAMDGQQTLARSNSCMNQRIDAVSPPKLVAFDVDGTLLRGETICECIGRNIGRSDEMKAFEILESQSEIARARRIMLEWYIPHGRTVLLGHLKALRLAPGAKAGIRCLREQGIKTALVSITWRFAVEWLAAELSADYAIGTDWLDSNEVVDFWPEDKSTWLTTLMTSLRISPKSLVAVGDSSGDIPMLKLAHRGYFIGETMPEAMPHVAHLPGANIQSIVNDILS